MPPPARTGSLPPVALRGSFGPFVLAAVVSACSGGDGSRTLGGAGAYTLTVAGDGRTLALARRGEVLLRLPADAFQLGVVDRLDDGQSYDPFWLEYSDELFQPEPPKSLRFRAVREAEVREDGAAIVLALTHDGGATSEVRLTAEAEGRFRLHWVPAAGPVVAYMRLVARSSAEEAFYGLGEHLDDVNQRGKLRPMQMEPDLSIESANNEAHVPVPLLIGTTGWGLFVESRRLGVFDVARGEADRVAVTYGTAEESAAGLIVHLFAAEHPLDITRRYYDVTGDPLLPAEWAYGPWIWRDENRDQAEVEEDIAKIRELDLATSAIWIDRPYATAVNTFDFEPRLYPDPAAMIRTARAAGLRVALWHTPYAAENAGEIHREAKERRFFVPRVGLRLNHWSDPIDFTSPEAYAWWQGLVRRYTELGIEGFKLDYGEDVLPGIGGARTFWRFTDGSDERTMHYGYTLLYHRLYAETLPESGGFLLCRAGRWGDQRYASVIWPGDLDADFTKHRERVMRKDRMVGSVGGLPASVIMGLTLGPSGFPFFGADTGGYRHSPPDREVWTRWVEQTALSSVMQVGDSSSQPPWVFTAENGRDETSVDLYRCYARLHLRLFPYAWTYARRLAVDGRPIQRALGLQHPELGVHPSDTYLFGDDLLVAPVLERGARRRAVHLPEGRWFDWWDGAVEVAEGARGRELEVAAPLEKLPLFVRGGALIPLLRPTIDTLAPATDADVESYANDPGPLTVLVAPLAAGASRFLVFDGTELSQRRDADGLHLGFQPGSRFGAAPTFEVFADTAPEAVRAGGEALERHADLEALEASGRGWAHAEGRLWIRFGASDREVVVR